MGSPGRRELGHGSLAERALSYVILVLLGLYFSAVLGGAQRGGALAAYVAVLYAALYGLLASENNALLLGALLVFAMLAALMLGTRHVDWWQLGGGKERGIEPPDFPEQG